jgi:hypothetical protein
MNLRAEIRADPRPAPPRKTRVSTRGDKIEKRVRKAPETCFVCGQRVEIVPGHVVGECCHAAHGRCGRCGKAGPK